MPRPIITLTTDFGEGSPYVAQIKGVILSLNREAALIDITHAIPPQDIKQGARVLDDVTDRFPAGTIHVAVVDPGVGTGRRIIAARIDQHLYVAPDNGLLSLVAHRSPPQQCVEVTNRKYWLAEISNTFHGRDIMAPVAAALSLGVDLAEIGPPARELSKLTWPEVEINEKLIKGTVVSFDSFGNLITDITARMLATVQDRSQLKIECGRHIVYGLVQTYGDVPGSSLVALVGSSGFLELAVVNGSAAQSLGVSVGEEVRVRW
jgi:S-adenosylmethionine hydrolase